MISTNVIIVHNVIAQLSYMESLDIKPHISLISPKKVNMKDNENLKGFFMLVLLAYIIRAIEIMMIMLFKHILNNAYFDIKIPSIMLLANAIKPIFKVIVFINYYLWVVV